MGGVPPYLDLGTPILPPDGVVYRDLHRGRKSPADTGDESAPLRSGRQAEQVARRGDQRGVVIQAVLETEVLNGYFSNPETLHRFSSVGRRERAQKELSLRGALRILRLSAAGTIGDDGREEECGLDDLPSCPTDIRGDQPYANDGGIVRCSQ